MYVIRQHMKQFWKVPCRTKYELQIYISKPCLSWFISKT